MAAKEISVKKYVVRLSGEERERLETLIRKGKSPARRVLKARILLKADVSEAGKGWSDNRIIEALETSPSMVYRVRKQCGCWRTRWATPLQPRLTHTQQAALSVDLSPLVLRAAGRCRLGLPDGWRRCRSFCGRVNLGFGELAAQVC